MKALIETGKTYKIWDFLVIPFAVTPVYTSFRILNRVVGSLIPSVNVLVTAKFVDTATAIFNGAEPKSAIYLPLALITAIVVYNTLNSALMKLANLKFDMKMAERYRSEVVDKRARLDYAHIENNDTWDLIKRTCGNAEGRISGGFDNLMNIAGIAIQVGSLLAIIMAQVWWAGLAIVGMSVPLFFLAFKGGKETYKANKEAEKVRRRADYLKRVLSDRENVEERALFGYTDSLNEKWYERYETARRINLKVQLKYFVRMKGSSLITVLLSVLIIGVLIFPLRQGDLTVGMFMGLVTGTFNLVQMMSWGLASTTQQLAEGKEYLKDLTAFCALSETAGALDKPVEPDKVSLESVEFKNVSFAYPGTDKMILKDFSLRMEKNLHYAFVGVNGAGKTTVTKLLTGMYDNFEGEILINGKSIREYSLAELKRLFSVVYQDFARYQIRARDAIAIGDVLADDEERLQAAIDTIGLREAIDKLPQKLDSYLGKVKEGAVDLSGGEWQRLAIARTFYGNAGMRILDEPTAALDPVAESNIYQMFGRVSTGKSTLFITHRLGAARLADVIVVIDGGRVAEQGSHAELMAKKGIYAEMFESQRSWYQ
jgi:ATP-binding cassette subfamily B protein